MKTSYLLLACASILLAGCEGIPKGPTFTRADSAPAGIRPAVAEAPAATGEIAYSAREQTVPPHKAWDIQFTLNVPAEIRVEFRVEQGKEIDFYVMTREQDQRASAGEEPTQPRRDYIRFSRGIMSQGSAVEELSPGNYNVIFRNTDDSPVKVWTRGLGNRQVSRTR